jgi:hypothetical protein
VPPFSSMPVGAGFPESTPDAHINAAGRADCAVNGILD